MRLILPAPPGGVPTLLRVIPVLAWLRAAAARMLQALASGSPARPHLLGVVEQLAAQISIQNIKTPKMPKLEILN